MEWNAKVEWRSAAGNSVKMCSVVCELEVDCRRVRSGDGAQYQNSMKVEEEYSQI